MARDLEDLTQDEIDKLAVKFEEAATTLGLTPTLCNRFIILPTEELKSLVFGSAAIGKSRITKEKLYFVQPTVAVTFTKAMAIEIIIGLEHHFNITDEERNAALKRFKNL